VTYPEQRYAGEVGRVTARLHPADAPPDLTTATAAVHYLATGATTDGLFGLYRWRMTDRPSGPSPHFHKTFAESFFVVSGEVGLYDGAGWRTAKPGDFLYVPPGGIHAFRNDSSNPAELLILFTPGAPREAYFEGLAERSASGQTFSPEEQEEFLNSHDQFTV
jgi:mannose-6-phosphate isomerase-like protein (cupin superfamily)